MGGGGGGGGAEKTTHRVRATPKNFNQSSNCNIRTLPTDHQRNHVFRVLLASLARPSSTGTLIYSFGMCGSELYSYIILAHRARQSLSCALPMTNSRPGAVLGQNPFIVD